MTTDLASVFEGLQITPSDEPMPEQHRGGTAGPNPFRNPLLASVEHSTPYNLYLPVVNPQEGQKVVNRAVFLINQAARKEDVGVRVWVNVKRDKAGKIIKGKDGKAQLAPETEGPNKGKVLVRFQGKKERKQQTAPRPYSVVKYDPKQGKDTDDYIVRRREDKQALFRGTKAACDAEYKRLTTEYKNTPQQGDPVAPVAENPGTGQASAPQNT